MTRRFWIVLFIYIAANSVFAIVIPLIPRSTSLELRFIIFIFMGPSLALFTHMFLLAYGAAIATTLPWFLGFAYSRNAWLLIIGIVAWLIWGLVFAYTLVPSTQ